MPYAVRKCPQHKNCWVKIKKTSGAIESHHKSYKKATASIKAYYANKGGKDGESV